MADALREGATAAAAAAYSGALPSSAWGPNSSRGPNPLVKGGGPLDPGASSPLSELWWAVACGAGALSDAELERVARELLQLGGARATGPAVAAAAASLRWYISFM